MGIRRANDRAGRPPAPPCRAPLPEPRVCNLPAPPISPESQQCSQQAQFRCPFLSFSLCQAQLPRLCVPGAPASHQGWPEPSWPELSFRAAGQGRLNRLRSFPGSPEVGTGEGAPGLTISHSLGLRKEEAPRESKATEGPCRPPQRACGLSTGHSTGPGSSDQQHSPVQSNLASGHDTAAPTRTPSCSPTLPPPPSLGTRVPYA